MNDNLKNVTLPERLSLISSKTEDFPPGSLVVNEERLRMAMDAANIGTFDWNIATGNVYWSENLEALMGLPRGGFGQTLEAFTQFVHPEDRSRVQGCIQQALSSGSQYQIEFRMIRADGSLRWVQALGQVHFDQTGAPVRMVGIDIDITDRKVTERKLILAEEKYEDFYDHAPDMLFSLECGTAVILECNQTACDALGYSKKELIRRPIFDFYHGDSLDAAQRAFECFSKTGFVHNVELQFRRRDGTVIDISLNASAVRENGKIVRSRSICRDITELKRAERALKQSEAESKARADELSTILDAVPAATFIARDPECRQMTSSRIGLELLRLPPGSNSSRSAPEGQRPTHFQVLRNGKVLSARELPVQTAAATGKPTLSEELKITFEDGTWRDIFGHAVPLLDQSGKVRGAVGAFVDITERKKAEAELARSEARLRKFVDSNLVGIVGSSVERGMFDANDVFLRMIGYSREEFRNTKLTWLNITPQEGHARGWQAIEELRTTGAFSPYETEYLRKDGSRIPVLTAGVAINQQPLEWMRFVVDLTERKHMEELKSREMIQRKLLEHEMLAREAERRRIARELHDEAGQTLASLLAGLSLIESAKSLTNAKVRAKKLRKTTTRAMDELGHLSRGLHSLALDDLGLATALKQYVAEFTQLHGVKITLTIKGFGQERVPRAVEAGVYRIVQEALTNTAKHAKARSAKVSIDITNGTLSLIIKDDGCGMDPERVAENSTGRLGLQGMKERVFMLGGEFSIDSALGKGTIIHARIPCN